MCDCYSEKCAKKGCPTYIPIHISDYCLDRDDFKAYCPEHIPKKKGILILTCIKQNEDDKYSMAKEGMSFGIEYKKKVKFPAPCCHDGKDYGFGKRCLHAKKEAVSINDAGEWRQRITR